MGAPHQCMPPEYMGPNPMGHPGATTPLGAPGAAGAAGGPPGSLVPPSPALKPSQPPGHIKNRRKASSPGPGTPGQPGSGIVMGGPPGSAGGYDTNDLSNPEGYEVNRSSDSKVEDVWREWKEGINDGPAVEKLEEARKRDRKLVWWKHKNDYKYWSKQVRQHAGSHSSGSLPLMSLSCHAQGLQVLKQADEAAHGLLLLFQRSTPSAPRAVWRGAALHELPSAAPVLLHSFFHASSAASCYWLCWVHCTFTDSGYSRCSAVFVPGADAHHSRDRAEVRRVRGQRGGGDPVLGGDPARGV